ncbi:MAG: hypothetical protein N5P05_001395 [Chroococcopsis gigantea SAG 12.99]|jgi:membrane protease YdiL (CAAX protease family)|nr:CPBP family intramembrane metalloprotease [Chlorogloea purpurea SAG 13.99]MDV2999789.1 hypothetical protein [Chroococcopsis gigantea SAG 12.99]
MIISVLQKISVLPYKKVLLWVLSIVALIPLVLSLASSVNQPQVQANLQLYQTNLNLQAADLPYDYLSDRDNGENLKILQTTLLGQNPYSTADQQYEDTRITAEKNLALLQKKYPPELLEKTRGNPLAAEINLLKDLKLKLGIIKAYGGDTGSAFKLWAELINPLNNLVTKPYIGKNAYLLTKLWSDPPEVVSDAEARIERTFKGWFRYVTLKRLYEVQGTIEQLATLETEQVDTAINALIKLTIVSLIPVIGSLLGVGIIIVLLVQLFLRKEKALLWISQDLAWSTPWNVETLVIVFILGFFLVGQIILPLIFGLTWGLLGINPARFNLQVKAGYVFISYLVMAGISLSILYGATKPFKPLPANWFSLRWFSNWLLWGLGGYLTALPLVIIVSLINQQIWQGQGGSNPLLSLALEAQDKVALLLFGITASLAAPIFEEWMFRGFLLPSLTRYLPVWGAIGCSSLIFALAHQNLSEVLPLTTLGIVLGIVYTRSKNLLASMLLHSLWNTGTLMSLFILGSSSG